MRIANTKSCIFFCNIKKKEYIHMNSENHILRVVLSHSKRHAMAQFFWR